MRGKFADYLPNDVEDPISTIIDSDQRYSYTGRRMTKSPQGIQLIEFANLLSFSAS